MKAVFTVKSSERDYVEFTFSIYDVSALEKMTDLYYIHIKGKQTPIMVSKETYLEVKDAFILANEGNDPCVE